jgi:hypothetical protein
MKGTSISKEVEKGMKREESLNLKLGGYQLGLKSE